jgi:hypothetical protein
MGARLRPVMRPKYRRSSPFLPFAQVRLLMPHQCSFRPSIHLPRSCPVNRTSPLPARNARICSRLVASESSVLMINSLHPELALQARLV